MLATEVACKHESIAKVFVITYRGEEASLTLWFDHIFPLQIWVKFAAFVKITEKSFVKAPVKVTFSNMEIFWTKIKWTKNLTFSIFLHVHQKYSFHPSQYAANLKQISYNLFLFYQVNFFQNIKCYVNLRCQWHRKVKELKGVSIKHTFYIKIWGSFVMFRCRGNRTFV